ncbi:MAG: hypothetical protein ACI89X_005032 [Planctomycetota bacterium]|jgi:hypothetical protein
MRKSIRGTLLAVCVSMFTACATLPSEIVVDATYVVAFKSSRLPSRFAWYVASAEHGWFDVRDQSGWKRVEILGRSTGVTIESIGDEEARSDWRFGDQQAHVINIYEGEAARVMGTQILAKAKQFPHDKNYEPFPGPNSNTFIEWMSHEVSGLWLEQYGNAVGKDYPMNGWVNFGLTTTRTGLELETPFVGVQAGLVEGVELHLLCLTLGVGIWPPRLKLPFLPGLPWELAH